MPNKIMLIWQCDKRSCEQINRRWVEEDELIFDDVCDHCSQSIHEPLTELVIPNEREE